MEGSSLFLPDSKVSLGPPYFLRHDRPVSTWTIVQVSTRFTWTAGPFFWRSGRRKPRGIRPSKEATEAGSSRLRGPERGLTCTASGPGPPDFRRTMSLASAYGRELGGRGAAGAGF